MLGTAWLAALVAGFDVGRVKPGQRPHSRMQLAYLGVTNAFAVLERLPTRNRDRTWRSLPHAIRSNGQAAPHAGRVRASLSGTTLVARRQSLVPEPQASMTCARPVGTDQARSQRSSTTFAAESADHN